MIQYFDTDTNQSYIDVATFMDLIRKNKAETHRLIQLFKIEKISYKNRILLNYETLEQIIPTLIP